MLLFRIAMFYVTSHYKIKLNRLLTGIYIHGNAYRNVSVMTTGTTIVIKTSGMNSKLMKVASAKKNPQ